MKSKHATLWMLGTILAVVSLAKQTRKLLTGGGRKVLEELKVIVHLQTCQLRIENW